MPRLRFCAPALALALLASALPTVSAADAGVTWYVHNFTDPTGTTAFLDNIPTGADESDQAAAGDPSPDPVTAAIPEKTASGPYHATGTSGLAKVWMKGFNGAPSPGHKVTVNILAGTTQIATGTLTQDIANPTSSIYEYDIPLAIAATVTIPAATKLTMEVTMENSACGCYLGTGYMRGVSPDHPWQFTLPLVSDATPPAGPVTLRYENVEGNTFNVTGAGGGVTQFNWTSTLTSGIVKFTVNGTGTLNATLVDAGNKTLLVVAAAKSQSAEFADATPGAWVTRVDARAFNGTYSFTIAAASGSDAGNGTGSASQTGGTSSMSTSGAGTGGTATSTSTTTKKSPMPIGLALLACAAALALARRR